MVHPCSNKVFVDNLLASESEQCCVTISEDGSVGHRIESQIRLGLQVYSIRIGVRAWLELRCRALVRRIRTLGIRAEQTCPRGHRGYWVNCSNAFRLPNTFEIREKESAVLNQWSANGPTELVALEGRFRLSRIFEEIASVQRTVSQELVGAAMKSIGA